MNVLELMRMGPVIPVIVIDQLAQAVPLARALVVATYLAASAATSSRRARAA